MDREVSFASVAMVVEDEDLSVIVRWCEQRRSVVVRWFRRSDIPMWDPENLPPRFLTEVEGREYTYDGFVSDHKLE